jgi:hypothetical protein
MTHPKPNFSRMMEVIDEVFATRNDPDQLQVTPPQLKKLEEIHPATLSELSDKHGPLIWVLVIPTTENVMQQFLKGFISEKELLNQTKPGEVYDCIYLCSATTLPEYRNKGETKKLCVKAIRAICKDHPIKTLFVWPFTREGEALAGAVARECGLSLLSKSGH